MRRRAVTIRQALQHVADNPTLNTDMLLDVPAHELVCRTLFEIANGGRVGDADSLSKANSARSLIFDRLVGKRRSGSHPATRKTQQLQFVDLTGEVES